MAVKIIKPCKTENWYFQHEEEEAVAREMVPYFERRIIEHLGKRKIDFNELKELTFYWVSSFLHSSTFWYENEMTREEFYSISRDKKRRIFLLQPEDSWNRAVEAYSQMGGAPMEKIIEENIRKKGSASLLDIGCGSLAFFDEVADKYQGKVECVGVSNMKVRERKGIKTVNSLAEILPEEWTDRFDLVTSFEASMYFYDNGRAFNEAVRVMKPEGKLFYGHGNLKSLGNDNLLERLLDVKDFQYTIKCKGKRNGEEYDGIFAKWLSVTYPFWDRLRKIENNGGRAEIENKKVAIKNIPSYSWCGQTLVVNGLGKI